jgi:hypothetical protein
MSNLFEIGYDPEEAFPGYYGEPVVDEPVVVDAEALQALIKKRNAEWGRRRWVYNDGGQGGTGIKGKGACVTRSIAIATKQPFDRVAKALDAIGSRGHRFGVGHWHYHPYLVGRGWEYVRVARKTSDRPTLRNAKLPKGTLIVKMAKHFACVKDGVIQDTWNCDLCRVEGYYQKKRSVRRPAANRHTN